MEFYFYDKYIHINRDEKEIKGTCMQLSRIFRVLMIWMSIKSEKIILQIFSAISP